MIKTLFHHNNKFSRKLYIAMLFIHMAVLHHFVITLIIVLLVFKIIPTPDNLVDIAAIIGTITVSLDVTSLFCLRFYLIGKQADT